MTAVHTHPTPSDNKTGIHPQTHVSGPNRKCGSWCTMLITSFQRQIQLSLSLSLSDVPWDQEHHGCTSTLGMACSCNNDNSEQDDDPSFDLSKKSSTSSSITKFRKTSSSPESPHPPRFTHISTQNWTCSIGTWRTVKKHTLTLARLGGLTRV